MESEILIKADEIISGIIEQKDPYEKIAVILKIIPIEIFDEVFRFFSLDDQARLLDALEVKSSVNSIESMLVINEFIDKSEMEIYLKTSTLLAEETVDAFQKYATNHPRKISQLLIETWLGKSIE